MVFVFLFFKGKLFLIRVKQTSFIDAFTSGIILNVVAFLVFFDTGYYILNSSVFLLLWTIKLPNLTPPNTDLFAGLLFQKYLFH